MAVLPQAATEGPQVLAMIAETTTPATRDGSGQMFDRIADRYDVLNRILSLGRDQRWRRQAARALAVDRSGRVLDLGTGTADLALLIANMHPTCAVIGVDPSERMLQLGAEKVRRAGLSERVELCRGEAEHIPFSGDSFDGVSMAFGIRNVPDRIRALQEIHRVLKPGARVSLLELTEPPATMIGRLARIHVRHVVPWLGALLSGSHEYRYLERSIQAFPPPGQFANLMGQAGLPVIDLRSFSAGACHLFVGEKRRSGR